MTFWNTSLKSCEINVGNSTTYFGQATVEFYDPTPTTTTTTATAKKTTTRASKKTTTTTTTEATVVSTTTQSIAPTTTTAPSATPDNEGEPRNSSNLVAFVLVSLVVAGVGIVTVILVATGKMKGILAIIQHK